jgi:thiamine pyrophosphate-dependent acetolactate synthase large subunit-like protein
VDVFVLCAGLTNTVTAVKNAQMAESPVLLIGGAAATLLKVGWLFVITQVNFLQVLVS